MVNTVITKNAVDIYQYPKEFEGNSDSITIGDLHGNTIKLLYFLIHHNVVKFKSSVENPTQAYQEILNLYEQCDEQTDLFERKKIEIRLTETRIGNLSKNLNRYEELRSLQFRNSKQIKEFNKLEFLELTQDLKQLEGTRTALEKNLKKIREDLYKIPGRFNQLLEQMEIKNPNVLVRLIGDEVADRGANDYFTLKLLEMLQHNGVKTTINISNPSNEFITAYENLINNGEFLPADGIDNRQKPSLRGLQLFYKEGLVSKDELIKLIETSYKPALKIIDYTLNAKGISLFTHAPIQFALIRNLAESLKVIYDNTTKEALAATIDKINTKFARIVEQNKVHEYCDASEIITIENMTSEEMASMPLVKIIWNPWNVKKDRDDTRPETVNGYKVDYFHGHDPYKSPYEHVNNLDTNLGKLSRKAQEDQVEKAKLILNDVNADNESKKEAQKYIDDVQLYKVLVSDESSLNQKHNVKLIDQEFSQPNLFKYRTPMITTLFTTIGLALGLIIGGGLIASGVLAPVGLGLWGLLGVAAALGGGLAVVSTLLGYTVAKVTKPLPINTVVETLKNTEIKKESMQVISKSLEPSNNPNSKAHDAEPIKPVDASFNSIFMESNPELTEIKNEYTSQPLKIKV